jgi:hypothetical protein
MKRVTGVGGIFFHSTGLFHAGCALSGTLVTKLRMSAFWQPIRCDE